MKTSFVLGLATFFSTQSGLAAPTARASGPTCKDVNFSVSITASVLEIPDNFAPSNISTYISGGTSGLTNTNVSGTYNIYGRFCEPEVSVTTKKDVLQLLVHGAARDHHYWNSYDFTGTPYGGYNYSWVSQASLQGYPTLSIDRLGDGLSSHPDPNTTVQLSTHAAIIDNLLKQIDAGILGRKFAETVYVGHSYGSLIGQLLAITYPSDFKRIILTGWAQLNARMTRSTATSGPVSGRASEIDPARFGTLPAGYNMSSNATYDGMMTFHDYGTPSAGLYFKPGFVEASFPYRQTSTNGETVSELLIVQNARDFVGKVLVLTGQNDAFWCGPADTADCGSDGSSPVATGRNVFPAAKSYDYYSPPNTGHELLYHYTAGQTFAKTWAWLESSA